MLYCPRPSLRTMRTRSAAFLAPSFSMMRARCTSMVRGLMPRWRPASLLEAPPAICAEHLALAPCQQLAAGKLRHQTRGLIVRGALHPGRNGLAHLRDHSVGIERLLDEVERAVLDRRDGSRNIALPGDDEDRRGIGLGLEILQDLQSRRARQVHVKQNASGHALPRRGKKTVPLQKACHVEAFDLNTAESRSSAAGSSSTMNISSGERPLETYRPPRICTQTFDESCSPINTYHKMPTVVEKYVQTSAGDLYS